MQGEINRINVFVSDHKLVLMISDNGKDCLPNNDEVTITHFVLCVVMTTVFSTTNNKTSKISLLQ
jgi:ATP-dependent Clp protease adapter protein ClpS